MSGIVVALLIPVAVPDDLALLLKMIIAMLDAVGLGSILGMLLGMVSGMIDGMITGMLVSMALMGTGSVKSLSVTGNVILGGIAGIIISVPLWYFNRYMRSRQHGAGKS